MKKIWNKSSHSVIFFLSLISQEMNKILNVEN